MLNAGAGISNIFHEVRFEVFTAMTMQETVFWDSPAPDNGGDTFLRNVGSNQKYTAQDPRRRFPAYFMKFKLIYLVLYKMKFIN
jgi:hypothetical protein